MCIGNCSSIKLGYYWYYFTMYLFVWLTQPKITFNNNDTFLCTNCHSDNYYSKIIKFHKKY